MLRLTVCQRLGGAPSTSASSVGAVAAGPGYIHLSVMIHPIHANDPFAKSMHLFVILYVARGGIIEIDRGEDRPHSILFRVFRNQRIRRNQRCSSGPRWWVVDVSEESCCLLHLAQAVFDEVIEIAQEICTVFRLALVQNVVTYACVVSWEHLAGSNCVVQVPASSDALG